MGVSINLLGFYSNNNYLKRSYYTVTDYTTPPSGGLTTPFETNIPNLAGEIRPYRAYVLLPSSGICVPLNTKNLVSSGASIGIDKTFYNSLSFGASLEPSHLLFYGVTQNTSAVPLKVILIIYENPDA